MTAAITALAAAPVRPRASARYFDHGARQHQAVASRTTSWPSRGGHTSASKGPIRASVIAILKARRRPWP